MRSSIRPLSKLPRFAPTMALILLVIFGRSVCAATPKNPNPTATLQLSELFQHNADKSIHSTLTFLSDDTLALLLCGDGAANCRLAVLQISGQRINVIAHKDIGQLPYDQATIDSLKKRDYTDQQRADIATRIKKSTRYGLYRYGAGFVVEPRNIYPYPPTVQWYSRNLSVGQQVPFPDLISRSGSTIACRIRKSVRDFTWEIYRVNSSVPPATEKVRMTPNLFALSDEQVSTPQWVKLKSRKWGKGEARIRVQIESLDGRVLGTVKELGQTVYNLDDSMDSSKASEVESEVSPINGMEFANGNRLYLQNRPGYGRDEILDFQGARLTRWRSPGELRGNERHGWTSDGSLLLYDRYTQKSSPLRRMGENATMYAWLPLFILSQGNALPPVVPENKNNEEMVQVLNTASGKSCFDWMGQNNDLDSLREYHADISPDGKRVAVLTPGTVALFNLPASCAGH